MDATLFVSYIQIVCENDVWKPYGVLRLSSCLTKSNQTYYDFSRSSILFHPFSFSFVNCSDHHLRTRGFKKNIVENSQFLISFHRNWGWKIGNEMENEMKSHLIHVLMSIKKNKRYVFWLPFVLNEMKNSCKWCVCVFCVTPRQVHGKM